MDEELPSINPEPIGFASQETADPLIPIQDTVGASARTSSSLAAAYRLMSRPIFTPDPAFSLRDAIDNAPEMATYIDYLAEVESQAEFDYNRANITRRNKDREMVAQSGWYGFAADTFFGIAAPETFIPVIGQSALTARLGVRAGTLAAGMATNIASTGVAELAFNADDVARTAEETTFSFLGTAALTAALGGAVALMPRKRVAEVGAAVLQGKPTGATMLDPEAQAAAVERGNMPFDAVAGRQSVGAAQNPLSPQAVDVDLRPLGTLTEAERATASIGARIHDLVVRTMGVTSVAFRGGVQEVSSTLRDFLGRTVGSGIVFKPGRVAAPGGAMEDIIESRGNRIIQDGLKVIEDHYMEMRTGRKEANAVDRALSVVPLGKISRSEFGKQVSRALNDPTADVHPQARAAAMKLKAGVIKEIGDELEKAGIIGGENGPKRLEDYLTHIYNKEAIEANPTAFIKDLADEYERVLNEKYATKLNKAKVAEKKDLNEIEDLTLGLQDARTVITKLQDYMKSIAMIPGGHLPYFRERRALRAEIRKRNNFVKADPADIARERMRAQGGEFVPSNVTQIGYLNRGGIEVRPDGQGNVTVMPKRTGDALRLSQDRILRDIQAEQAAMQLEIDKFQEQMKTLRDNLSPEEREIVDEYNDALTRIYKLQKNLGILGEKQVAALRRVDELKELNVDMLWRMNNELKKFNAGMEKLSESEVKKKAEKLRDELEKIGKSYIKNEEKIEKLLDENPELSTSDDIFRRRMQRFRLKHIPTNKTGAKGEKILVAETVADRQELQSYLDDALADPEITPSQARSIHALRDELDETNLTPKDPATLNELFDQAIGLENRGDTLMEKLQQTQAKLASLEDVKGMRDELRALQDASLADLQHRIAQNAVKQVSRLDAAKAKDPSIGRARILDLERGIAARRLELENKLERRGVTAGLDFSGKTQPDFRDYAEEQATKMKNEILGGGVRAFGLDTLQERGPELARAHNMPYAVKEKWLETEPERIIRALTRQTISDTTIKNVYGKVNPTEDLVAQISVEFDDAVRARADRYAQDVTEAMGKGASARKLRKLEKAHAADQQRLQRDRKDANAIVEGIIQRLRNRRGLPSDSNDPFYRMGKTAMELNVARLMANTGVYSLIDPVTAIARYGIRNIWGHALRPMLANYKEFRMAKEAALQAGLNEIVMQTRNAQLYDLMEDAGRRTKGEQFIAYAASRVGILSLSVAFTHHLKKFFAPVAMGALMDAAVKLRAGENVKARAIVTQLGFDDAALQGLWREMDRGTIRKTPEAKVWVTDSEDFESSQLTSTLNSAIMNSLNRAIVTPGIDKPLWTDANMFGKIVNQFMSFMYAAQNKVLLPGVQMADYRILEAMAASIPLGMLSITVDYSARGRFDELENWSEEKWIDEIIARGPWLGAFAKLKQIADTNPEMASLVNFSKEGTDRRWAGSTAGAVAGPSIDLIFQLERVFQGITDPTVSTAQALRRLFPLNNLTYTRQLHDYVIENSGLPSER
jgi:hypothetical protein